MQKLYTEEHDLFRESFRAFLLKEALPYYPQWEKDGIVNRNFWIKAGELGVLGVDIATEYGGLGLCDFRYNAIISEEFSKLSMPGIGIAIQNGIVIPYLNTYCTPIQKAKYLPKMASGEWIGALALTESEAGSDLKGIQTYAEKKNGHYLLNGAKTMISNGIHADVVITFVKTSREPGSKSYSLFVLERGMDGFKRGENINKIGYQSQDTADLFFENIKVPFENVLGEPNKGFYYLMHNLTQERLGIAIGCIANAEALLEETMEYCKNRKAFGKQIGSFQNSRFKIAEMKTECTIARNFVNTCIWELIQNTLTPEKAAMAKYWVSEMQSRVLDQCLQLHGGYGYMNEYKIAQAWRDARIQRINGGTNEIMKEIIGRTLGF